MTINPTGSRPLLKREASVDAPAWAFSSGLETECGQLSTDSAVFARDGDGRDVLQSFEIVLNVSCNLVKRKNQSINLQM